MTPYDRGYAMFHRGKTPHPMPQTNAEYYALSAAQQQVLQGWAAARDDMRRAYAGSMPSGTRPIPTPIADMPSGEARRLRRADARFAAAGNGVNLTIPKAFRRKGRNAITLRYSGSGARLVWQEQTFPLDDLNGSERETLITNVVTMSAGG